MRTRSRLLAVMISAVVLLGVTGWSAGWFAPEDITVTEVAPGIYFRKCATKPVFLGCNQGWVIFKDFVLVIDANFPNQAEELIKEVRKTTDKPIKYVFDTHYHGDHADGTVIFQKLGAMAIANENSQELFATKGKAGFESSKTSNAEVYGKLDYGTPEIYFPRKLVLDDGTQRVELLHLGHAHTAGDAFAWIPKHGILFTGDACVNGQFNYTGDSNTASWISVLTELEQLPIKHIYPGHGEASDKSLIGLQRRYFVELRQYIQQAIDGGKTMAMIQEQISLPFYKEWTGVDVKENTENIQHVYKELTGNKPQ